MVNQDIVIELCQEYIYQVVYRGRSQLPIYHTPKFTKIKYQNSQLT